MPIGGPVDEDEERRRKRRERFLRYEMVFGQLECFIDVNYRDKTADPKGTSKFAPPPVSLVFPMSV